MNTNKNNMGAKILIVIDYQYDFIKPNGTLYVNGAEQLQDKIATIIPNFDYVIFTKDTHPIKHCSFVENGGQWPAHCVYNTIGNGIPLEFMKLAKQYTFIDKGTDENKEEYSAFENKCDLLLLLDYEDYYCNWESEDLVDEQKLLQNIDEIVVCGVAGDYCVLESLKDIVSHIGSNKIKVYLDGVASIDGGIKLNAYMKENSIKTY
jgi:nicotinamidase-related amidase